MKTWKRLFVSATSMFRIRFARTKKLPWKPKKDIGRTCLVYLGFHGSFVFVISPVTHGLFDRALGSYSR